MRVDPKKIEAEILEIEAKLLPLDERHTALSREIDAYMSDFEPRARMLKLEVDLQHLQGRIARLRGKKQKPSRVKKILRLRTRRDKLERRYKKLGDEIRIYFESLSCVLEAKRINKEMKPLERRGGNLQRALDSIKGRKQ